ncbi:hypothetical protein GCM10025870_11010 [Agromyces marinus]|uniref:Uncharacterized protein n=1 Tax=Agromyces marinus TaxID=1389020 RepID=A0ABM8GZX3_9MICO|nr:hypothetical protein GCM10025870_11010 [Agromyces marinus]
MATERDHEVLRAVERDGDELAVTRDAGHPLADEARQGPGPGLGHAELEHVDRGDRAPDEPRREFVGEGLHLRGFRHAASLAHPSDGRDADGRTCRRTRGRRARVRARARVARSASAQVAWVPYGVCPSTPDADDSRSS